MWDLKRDLWSNLAVLGRHIVLVTVLTHRPKAGNVGLSKVSSVGPIMVTA